MPADLKRLKDARHKVAQLLVLDPAYAPIFARLEREIAAVEETNDMIERARRVLELHKATA